MNVESKMKASDIPSDCLQDPQFVKVLTASLCSQIAESKRILADTDGEIRELKNKVEHGLEKRKFLKQINKDLKQKKTMQEAVLESLERDGKQRSTEIEMAKNSLDDATLRHKAERAKFEKILDEYGVMWQRYKVAYEDFPLAKEREESRVTAQKLNVQCMVIEYKRAELVKMLKLRKKIDATRIRAAGVDVSKMVLQRWKDEKYLDYLQTVGAKLRIELEAYSSELSRLREADEKAKLLEIETSKMPPPRLDFSFMRSVSAAERNIRKGRMSPRRESDAMSVDTLMLEEMCNEATNDKRVENDEKSNCATQEKEEHMRASMTMIQVSEPVAPFLSQTDKNGPESISVVDSNIEDKLQKLGIEKTQMVQHSEEPKDNDDKMDGEENKDYEYGMEESFRRTRRWCEESRKELAPRLLSGHWSNSAKEWRQGEFNDEDVNTAGGNVRKALSSLIHESEARTTNEPSYVIGSKWSLYNEKGVGITTPRSSRWCENFSQKTPSQVSLLGKRKRQQQTPKPDTMLRTNNYENYDGQEKVNDGATQASQRSDDTLEVPINGSNNRPKIMAIDKINYPLGQRSGHTVAGNTRPFKHLGSRNYVSSYMSSDNLSNAIESACLQEIPPDSFMIECEETPGYPLLTTSQNSSPPREQSLISFVTSTVVDQQVNNDSAINQRRCPTTEKTPASPKNFGEFFANKRQERRTMF